MAMRGEAVSMSVAFRVWSVPLNRLGRPVMPIFDVFRRLTVRFFQMLCWYGR